MELPRQQFAPLGERLAAGKALRDAVPRRSHATWTPPADRPDPVATLGAADVDRLPELVPIRYGRMLVSPFAFLRGSASVMAVDLAGSPTTGVTVQVCGDCHLMNFGLFATPERNVVFGLNDFDETAPGPWEFDVKRLAASFVVAALDAGLGETLARRGAVAAVRSYRDCLWEHVAQSPLDVWYERIDLEREIAAAPDKQARSRRQRMAERARARVGDQLVPKLVRADGDAMTIVDQPPLNFHPEVEDPHGLALGFLATYRESRPADRRVLFDRYELRDVAVKVVGVGSVGTRCLIGLMSSAAGHPLFLQVKEASASVLEAVTEGPHMAHHGERVVLGQRLMQPASDIFLGWGTGPGGRHFYVRQLRDMKLSVTLQRDPVGMMRYAEYCGRALARAHANSGDPAVIAGYLGRSDRFDEAIGTWALAYATQTVEDHAALAAAAEEGRIEVIEETA
jgi:uncharacterized protein (DUF2252 family)